MFSPEWMVLFFSKPSIIREKGKVIDFENVT